MGKSLAGLEMGHQACVVLPRPRPDTWDGLPPASLAEFQFKEFPCPSAAHSSILTWRISGTGEPGGLPSMGSHRVGHNLATEQQQNSALYRAYGLVYLPGLNRFYDSTDCGWAISLPGKET